MATPIGHALAGYAVYCASAGAERQDRRALLGLCLLMALAPDLDFLPGIFMGQPALYHQGISHSLSVAVVTSLGLALVYSSKRGTVLADGGRFTLAYASHLAIDLFGPDKRPPYGEPLFWPLSGEYYLSPTQIFWGVHHASSTSAATGEWVTAILHPYNVGAIVTEVLVLFPIILLVWYIKKFFQRIESDVKTASAINSSK